MAGAYYNEIDPFAAQWLRNLIAAGLIADGDVDERSIEDVRGDDVRGYTQCHFFAGIGGWSYALRLAGWPDDRPVWTGSCPCQPFSVAGLGTAESDARHLWPFFRNIINKCNPATVFGEQVAGPLGAQWCDSVASHFAKAGYAFASCVLQAAAFGAPQARERTYFVAESVRTTTTGRIEAGGWGKSDRQVSRAWNGAENDVSCVRDRYVLLADGVSSYVAKRCAGGFGNAIVPQVAAEFIGAYLDLEA